MNKVHNNKTVQQGVSSDVKLSQVI